MAVISFGPYRFTPRVLPTLAAILACLLTFSLGSWQTRRADEKMALQQRLDDLLKLPPVELPRTRVEANAVVDHRIVIRGRFVPERTIYIDNRVQRGVPGYHVVTPLRIEGGDMHVLVNRGWIAAGLSRERLPAVKTPDGVITVEGIGSVPVSNPYQLAPDVTEGAVRQHLVLERLEMETRLALQPVIILQTSLADDGLVRDWPKVDAGANTHRAYALQWYVMAIAAFAAWIGLNLHKVKQT